MALKRERTHHINRFKGLLASQGVKMVIKPDFLTQLQTVRLWDGKQIRREAIRNGDNPTMEQIRQLLRLKGIGVNSVWVYVMEFFAWRNFRNRRERDALAGLAPTPYQIGDGGWEQGISKAGNRSVRAMAIEITWAWVPHQPDNALGIWYQKRFGHGDSRIRCIGIVALARKLLIALWRHLELGVLPEGAILKQV
jgi:transposase